MARQAQRKPRSGARETGVEPSKTAALSMVMITEVLYFSRSGRRTAGQVWRVEGEGR